MDITTDHNVRARRTLFGVPVFVWVLLTAGVAAAVIGFAVWLNTTGFVQLGDGIDIEFVPGTEVATTGNENTGGAAAGTCTVTATATEIDIQADGLVAYDYCYITVDVVNNGDANAVLQRWDTDLPEDLFHRTITNVFNGENYCGTVITSAGGQAEVGFQIQVHEGATPGERYDFSGGATDALMFVREDLWDGGTSCP